MNFFLKNWLSRGPSSRTPLIRYTELNGIFYILTGLFLFFLPKVPSNFGRFPPLQGQEEGLVRLIGFSLSIIGYFYYFGARTHQKSFALSTIVDRLILVPLFFSILLIFDLIDKNFILGLFILDPLLALGALYLWTKEPKEDS